MYLMNQRWTWKPICSSMNLAMTNCRFMPWPSSEVSVKCAAAYPDRATTSIHPTRCTHARMVVHGFLGPWCQLTSVSATIKIPWPTNEYGRFPGHVELLDWVNLETSHLQFWSIFGEIQGGGRETLGTMPSTLPWVPLLWSFLFWHLKRRSPGVTIVIHEVYCFFLFLIWTIWSSYLPKPPK